MAGYEPALHTQRFWKSKLAIPQETSGYFTKYRLSYVKRNISLEIGMRTSKSINKVMSPVEWSLLIMLSVLWGGSFFFSKVALAELRPFTLVLGRVSLAAIALNVIVMVRGQRMPSSLITWGRFFESAQGTIAARGSNPWR